MADELNLLPCPLCGEEARSVNNGAWEGGGYVECIECGATTGSKRTVLHAVEAWNERAAPIAAQLDAELPPPKAPANEYFSDEPVYSKSEVEQIVAPHAERIRLLTEELATFKAEHATLRAGQSIGDDEHFCDLITELHAAHEEVNPESSKKAWGALCSYIHDWAGRAYIDGRTAGTAWISVNDRLPEDCAFVAIFDPDNEEIHARTSQWLAGSGTFESEMGWLSKDEVSHWMPLPAAPSLSGTEEAK